MTLEAESTKSRIPERTHRPLREVSRVQCGYRDESRAAQAARTS